MRPVYGPVVSSASASARIWSLNEVRAGASLARERTLAERALVVPKHVVIVDEDALARARTERRWELG